MAGGAHSPQQVKGGGQRVCFAKVIRFFKIPQESGISYGILRLFFFFRYSRLQANSTFRLHTLQDYFLCLIILKDFKMFLSPPVEDELLYRIDLSNCYMEGRKSGVVLNEQSDTVRYLEAQGRAGWSLPHVAGHSSVHNVPGSLELLPGKWYICAYNLP